MGESTLEWAKRQKTSAGQISRTNAVCEDCGRKWTATLTEVPVTIFIKDLDEYYKKLSKNLLEAVEPEMVLCVFRPSDRDVWDTEVTLSVVAPRQDSPYHWRINHKFSGPAAASGCQISIWKADQSSASKSDDVCIEQDIVTVKEEIKEEINEEDEIMVEEGGFDPLAGNRNDDPDDPDQDWTNSDTDTINMDKETCSQHLSTKNNTEVHQRFVKTSEENIQRFVKTSEENILAIKEGQYEEKTMNSTKWGIRIFKDWLKENNLSIAFETYSPSEMDTLLARFYVEVRRVDGEHYTKPSYVCLRAAIRRHLQSSPWNVKYCILKDSTFNHSNFVLKGVFKKLTKMGASVSHFKEIKSDDILKLIETGVIGLHNPHALLNLVWLSVALQFGKKQQGSYRSMNKDTFIRSTDEAGCDFYEYEMCKSQKDNSSRSLSMPQRRMYARPGDPLCPVTAMDKYLSLLHPDLHCLWQQPNPRFQRFDEESRWYNKTPVGRHTISKMMHTMSKEAKLSQIYTNHCTKVTVCKALMDAKFDRSDIIRKTGHRDKRSLDTYLGATSSSKRALSDTLSNLTCRQGNNDTNIKRKQNQLQDSTASSLEQSDSSPASPSSVTLTTE